MAQPAELRPVEYRRLFPWLHLARAFRMAVDPRKLLLAGLALVAINAMDAGWNAIRERKSADEPDHLIDVSDWPWNRMEDFVDSSGTELVLDSANPMAIAGHVWNVAWAGGVALLLEPLMTVGRPLALLFQPVSPIDKAYLVVRLLWALCVWAIVAGAITRMVALEFARDERLGTVTAVRYACGRFFSFLLAPLIAVICIAFIVLLCFLGGLIGAIPYLGPLFAGILWFLPLLAGFVIAMILVGAILGWPLMYATISVQDSDAFDGFSRSYTFVYGRPWYVGLLAVVTVLLSVAGFGVVYVFTAGTDLASRGAVATGMGTDNVTDLVGVPRLETKRENEVRVDADTPANERGLRSAVHPNSGTWAGAFWRRMAMLLAAGFGASFFWCSATISYFLLRRADDGTSLDEVELPYDGGDAPHDHLAPLAGVEPRERNVQERPIVELSTSPTQPETLPLAEGEADATAEDDSAGEGETRES